MASNCATPTAWQRKCISDLFEVRAAGDIEWSKWNLDHDSHHPFPVYANGRSKSGLHGYASYAVEQGNAITLTARGTLGELGFAFFRMSAFTPIGRLLVLRSKGEADARFFTSYINGVVRFSQENTGVAQLTAPQVTRCEVDVPPLSEQRAIATVLSDVDALIAGLERLIAKKRDIKQAAMQRLLTGQTRLPGFDVEWQIKLLPELADIRSGGTPSTNDPAAWDGDIAWCTPTDITALSGGKYLTDTARRITAHGLKQSSAEVIPAGSIVMTSRATIGECAINVGPVSTNQGFKNFVPFQHVDAEFLYYLLSTQKAGFISLCGGSTFLEIGKAQLRGYEVRLPAEKTEQTAIATVLSDMDADLYALESRLAKTRAIKQGMMQELLTGRTRLVDSVAQVPVQKTESADERKANIYFMRSVLAAEIVDQLHQEPTFGHVKFEKMMFLAEHLCHVDTGSHYARKTAGPLDRKALHSIDSQLRSQKWFDGRKEDGRYRYVPLDKRGGHKNYFDRYFAPIRTQLSEILDTFRSWDTERCEIVATLYAAWNDLLQEKGAVSDEMIVHEVLNNWHESKQRIPEERWLKALGWMREKSYVPGPVAEPNAR